jgi:hypothetical protein
MRRHSPDGCLLIMETDNKVRERTEPKNIIYTGDGDGTAHINTATETIYLPENQKKGFYHKEANKIIQMFPHLYKRVKPKGEK